MAILIQAENFLTNSAPIAFPSSFMSSCSEETFALGKCLALYLQKGSIIALEGPLGAGKTCFVKGIASGLGIAENVTSPTYTIISEYEGIIKGEKSAEPVAFYHIDAYRLGGVNDFTAIGGEEILFGEGISAIEWSCRIEAIIPKCAFRVDMEIIGENKRLIRICREKK